MPGRPRAYVKPAPPPPSSDLSLPPSQRGKMLTPKEVGDLLGIAPSEVLILPGLVRVSISPQRVVYAPSDVEDFINGKRMTQGFQSGFGALFGPPNRAVTVNSVSTVMRIGRPPARWLLEQCERPSAEELAKVLRRFVSVQ